VAALHAAPTLPALADGHAKFVDHGALHRQVFLLLRDDVAGPDRTAAVWTRRGQWRVVRHVHTRRRTAMGLLAVRVARLASRPVGMLLRQPARKRGGLPIGPAPRHLELFLQSLVFAAQPIALDLRTPQILFQPLNAAGLVVDDLPRISGWRILGATST
jgi:hypothetical protein